MLSPLKIVRAGLRRTTEALATELAAAPPGSPTPAWSELEWRLARAAAVGHGVSPLLSTVSNWENPDWRSFLDSQREHVAHRHGRIAALLDGIDSGARAAGLAVVPLKGSALHALGIYRRGERPMADIDLLVREADAAAATVLLRELGYLEAYANWKHRVFKPSSGQVVPVMGEHRDNPITIELHTRIREPLPVSAVDITARIYPVRPHPGLNPYPSNGALMSHLLLHAAGNICIRCVRLVQLNDIALLAARMTPADWEILWNDERPWWVLPPLRLTARYYRGALPEPILKRLESACPPLLRRLSHRLTLTDGSCSGLWITALPGIEWSRSIREAARYSRYRIWPAPETTRELLPGTATPAWVRTQRWAHLSRGRQILVRLTGPVPRMDTLYLIRAACEGSTASVTAT